MTCLFALNLVRRCNKTCIDILPGCTYVGTAAGIFASHQSGPSPRPYFSPISLGTTVDVVSPCAYIFPPVGKSGSIPPTLPPGLSIDTIISKTSNSGFGGRVWDETGRCGYLEAHVLTRRCSRDRMDISTRVRRCVMDKIHCTHSSFCSPSLVDRRTEVLAG